MSLVDPASPACLCCKTHDLFPCRVKDLSNPAHKFKVEANANQLFMTGYVALHRDCNVVVLEGGPKQQKKMRKVMLQRIKWEDRLKGAKQLDPEAAQTGTGPKEFCTLVWEVRRWRFVFPL